MRFGNCLLIFSVFLASCEPFVNSRGNVVAEKHLGSFVIGQTTMEDVLKSCGTPSLHRDNFTWIYLGGRSEETSFRGVEMKDRTAIKLTFDANKVLKNKEVIRPSNSEFSFDEETTDLISNKEAGALLNSAHE
ncbi:MAG: outer membrane protein assembly factor BamE [Alphaproteobacteria bacterium]|nr:outer membrane protein assembly factor BamE [Alphaproteobacteria bacterium]